jgi:acetyl-CoA carboxylase biotin carboxyl carrier protein
MPIKNKTPNNKNKPKGTSRSAELSLIDSLAEILNATGLTEIELEQKGVRVRVAKTVNATVQHVSAAPVTVAAAATPMAAAPAPKPEATGDHPGAVKSPMVGTVYMSSSPGAAAFIEIGTVVKEGQTLLIIEAMKTMNQIAATRAGKVTAILVDNGTPVEFGETLLVIE